MIYILPDDHRSPHRRCPRSGAKLSQQVLQIITAAEAHDQQRLAEMNRQVLDNLDNIITTLETDTEAAGSEAPDAG